MHALPQTGSITDLKNSQASILRKVQAAPVLLMQRSKPTMVLVSPAQWDETAHQLATQQQRIVELERTIQELKDQLRLAVLDKRSIEMQHVSGVAIPWSEIEAGLMDA
jgi:prevent-host-death family protein